MTSRKEFEAHIRKQFPTASDDLLLGRSSNGHYGSMVTEHAWLAWLAATDAALARAEKACEAIENDKWALYKGRKPYTGNEPGRASDYAQGQSDGAGDCADAIRALKEES